MVNIQYDRRIIMTLVILAAGMGSRYGGLKQIDPVTSEGEFIIDFSVYDAIVSGFDRVVFVIKRENLDIFRDTIGKRFENKIKVEYAFQELDYLPEGFTLPEGRVKPWGTNHAVMMAAKAINEPFAVINADDFYGRTAYVTIGDYLKQLADSEGRYCMVGYQVSKTLSENGTVSRGVCTVDEEGNLRGMVERTQIERVDGTIVFHDGGADEPLAEDTPVSMNLFGFTPDYFRHSEAYFKEFLPANIDNLKAEFFIPLMVNKVINDGTATMRVLKTTSDWFGVTYKEDKPMLMAKIEELIAAGEYPRNLWE